MDRLSKRHCFAALIVLLVTALVAGCTQTSGVIGLPTTSSMEVIHASYLDISSNISDLRSRIDQWEKGDEGSLNVAKEKLERIQAIMSDTGWPRTMATAIAKTQASIGPMAKALDMKDVGAAQAEAKTIGDASHDITHAFYGDWLPELRGAQFTAMAPHVIYLDLNANLADLQSRVTAWQQGDDSSLNVAKEKVERIGALVQHIASTGVLIKQTRAIEADLPTISAALEKADKAAVTRALKPISDTSASLTRDFYTWMDIAANTHDPACVQASYLDLSHNISALQTSITAWQKGDANAPKTAQERLERVTTVISHSTWPASMVAAVQKTGLAVDPMAKAVAEKNVSGAQAAATGFSDASHDVTHAFYVDWLPIANTPTGLTQMMASMDQSMPGTDHGMAGMDHQMGTAPGQTAASAQSAGQGDDHGHSEGAAVAGASTGPNYWFVGFVISVVAITIVMVPILRRRDLALQAAKIGRGDGRVQSAGTT